MYPDIKLRLPGWVVEFCESWEGSFGSVEGRARFVVELARQNVERDCGGPFAAAVFDLERESLVAPGVNLVVPASCSVAHAEMVALMVSEQIMGTHNLGAEGLPRLELVSSTEPCAMCMGAIPWSGIPSLVCCANGDDALAIGFDEGAKPQNWPDEMRKRGIEVKRDVLREEAADVLREYVRRGGVIY
jgi:tRNA(Arg) A34 adenosine deaminase TadA